MTLDESYPTTTWRLLNTGAADGATNMAIDEALLESVQAGTSLPTLRFYAWEPACLSLGIGQPYDCVDEARCYALGWDVVRRTTGGRAILHIDELTYSVSVPLDEPRVAGSIATSYQHLSQALMAGLHALGVRVDRAWGIDTTPQAEKGPICFDTPADYEITLNGRKLVGSAQRRRQEALIQHGTLPLYGDVTRIAEALRYDTAEARDQAKRLLRTQAATAADGLSHPVNFETAVHHMTTGFAQALNLTFRPDVLTEQEQARVQALRATKYAHPSWTKRR